MRSANPECQPRRMPRPSARYRATDRSDDTASPGPRGALSGRFDRTWSGTPGRPQSGHPETFCDGAVPVCRTMRVRFGRPPRQTAGLVESPLKLTGLDRPVPDFPTRCRRQARIAVQVPFRGSGGPLRLRVDSTGVRFRGEWRVRKHGPSRRGQWRKAHIARDAGTGDIRAVEFTSSRQGGSPPLPELFKSPRMKHLHRGSRSGL